MLELIANGVALLIIAGLGYNCFIRVRNIIRADEQKRISKRSSGIQPHDDE